MTKRCVNRPLACYLVVLSGCWLWSSPAVHGQPSEPAPRARQTAEQAIDFQRARELLRKVQSGERLTADEQTYLDRARAARRSSQQQANRPPAGQRSPAAGNPTQQRVVDASSLRPLTELTAADRYHGEDGGLYGSGQNMPPQRHQAAANAATEAVQPRDAGGRPDPEGRIALVSISMSNATQEFSTFKRIADADPDKSKQVTIVDCAQGGQAMAQWADPRAHCWQEAARRIEAAGISPAQVQVAWIKLANKSPQGSLHEHGKQLQADTQRVVQIAKQRFPNLQVVYLSSRTYGGYARSNLNPEPYAYESAFAARWLIQQQMGGDAALNSDLSRGEVKAPVLLWGPYLWASGTTPRTADALVWTRDDFVADGVHPSPAGRDKVAGLLLRFFQQDPLAASWFVRTPAP